ncbi:tripartite motif-containing protein 16-like [Aplochiton taeniatus]
MASTTTISVEQDQFSCPVCLDVLKDPVTIPCGHSYCLDCIEDYWSRNNNEGVYSCPQCRLTFKPRPGLSRNTVLAEVVEKFRGTAVRAALPQQFIRAGEVVKCSVCIGNSNRAVKSCLVCVESYCKTHLRVHEARFHGKAHKLITALGQLRDKICPYHEKVLRIYCRTDKQFVCSQCAKDRHTGHDTLSVVDERAAQQKKLEDTFLRSIEKMKDTEKELKNVVRYIKHSADVAIEDSERIFSKLARSVEKQRFEVREIIQAQEKAAVSQAEELLKQLEKDMAELRMRDAELERLSIVEDHILFLQRCKSFHLPSKVVDLPHIDDHPYSMPRTVRDALVDLKDRLDAVCEREIARLPNRNYNDITLDANTANRYLFLTDGRRMATTVAEAQLYPDHLERFTSWAQVLCREGMAGRCYWEVEWDGTRGVSIGVCYRGMKRQGGESDSKLGHNAKSWSLDCSPSACSFHHDKDSVLMAGPCASRVGVYLDFSGGTLSFYSISGSTRLLHRVRTTFTQPLYPGFWVGLGSTLKLSSYKGLD